MDMKVVRGSTPRLAACVVVGLLIALPGWALFVEVQFFGGVEIAAFETYAWREGSRAGSFEVESAIRAAVEERMAAKGYRRVDGEATADAYLRTHVIKDLDFPAGVLKVEMIDGGTDELVWLGMATGVVGTDKPKKVGKVARRSIQKMFKSFPSQSSFK